MTTSPLAIARAAAEVAREQFTALKAAFHRAENTARIAAGAAREERANRIIGPYGGNTTETLTPAGTEVIRTRRGVPGAAAPTALEITAQSAEKTRERAEHAMNSAQLTLSAAEAELLRIENEILNRHRDGLAKRIREAQRGGDSDTEAALLGELKAACPHETAVRLNQRFKLSLAVRELIESQPNVMMIDVPVHLLRGDDSGAWEALRAAILDASEAAHAATHQQEAVA